MTALAVFRAAAAVVTHRVHKLNNEANKTVLAGKECHDSLLIQQDRAAYLADHLQLAVADVTELVEANRAYDRCFALYEFDQCTADDVMDAYHRRLVALAKFEVRP